MDEPTTTQDPPLGDPPTEDPPEASRRAGTTYDRVVVALLCLVGVQIGQRPLNDNSFFTHLATGRIILDGGGIPRSDPYTFSAHGASWTVQSWLASVFYAGAEAIGGLTLVRLMVVGLTVALVLLVWRLTAPAGTLVGRLLPTIAVIVVGNTYWSERPLMFGLIGLALVLLVADDGLHPAWLVPVMWIWVNTHGSFPFAPVVLGLLVAGRWLDRESAHVELRATAWCLVGIAAGAVNPLGPKLLVFPLGLLEKREAFAAIVEWQAPAWDLWSQRVFAVLAVGGLAAVLVRRRRWRSILPILVFSAAAATSMRNIAQASIVVAFAVAPALAGLGRTTVQDRRPINRPATVAFGVLAVLFLVVGLSGPDTDLADYPTTASAWMDDQGFLGPSSRILSPETTGNYLEARFGPDEVQVFVDDRVDMFPMSVIDDYLLLRDEARTDEFGGVLGRIAPTAVLWPVDSPLGRWLDGGEPGWTIVHRDDDWLVAVPS
ncbi:MAG: hypothetical protein KF906_10610 [Actinobacteria bacterium]|nr:hypothetical protein [Actinomycetota bacterium]